MLIHNKIKYFFIFLAIYYAHGAVAGGIWDRINRDKTIKIAIIKDKPYFSTLKGANYEGYDADYARNIASMLNVSPILVPIDEKELLRGNWGAKFDVAFASTPSSPELAKNFEIIDYYYLHHMVVVSQGMNPKNKLSDLARGAMGTMEGSFAEKYIEKKLDRVDIPFIPKYSFRFTPSGNRSFKSINEGITEIAKPNNKDMETILIPSFEAKLAIGRGIPLRVFPEPLYYEPIVAIAEKGDRELAFKVKEAINRMRQTGTAKRIAQKYFNEDISQPLL